MATPQERQVALALMDVLAQYELRPQDAPSRLALLAPALQARITDAVQDKLLPVQTSLLPGGNPVTLADLVRRAVVVVVQQTIDIPRIAVVPQGPVPQGEARSGFSPFTLDLAGLSLRPKDRSLVGQSLRTQAQFTLAAQAGHDTGRLEDSVVQALTEFDDIDYTAQANLLYALAGQLVAHLRSTLADDAEVRSVLALDRQAIASNLHAQLMAHRIESTTACAVQVRRGFTALKAPTFTVAAGQPVRDYRLTVDEPARIPQMVFGHFLRCLYPLQKFDSDTERRLAVILERDAIKWFKPAKGQFQLFYKLGAAQAEYLPDFVAEDAQRLLLCETKARNQLASAEVLAKAEAGALWCQRASDHARLHNGKAWHYLLIPHDVVTEDKRLVDFLGFEVRAGA